MNFIRALVGSLILLCCATSAVAAPAANTTKKVDGHTGYNSGRGAFLPTGAGKLYLSLTLADDWQSDPRQAAAEGWFNSNRRLAAVRSQTNWNLYTLSNPHFRDQLARFYGTAVPILTLQRPDGEILLNVTARSWPTTSGELADMVDDAIEPLYAAPAFAGQSDETPIELEDCPPDGPCPPDRPCPYGPEPPLDVQPQIPDVVPSSRSTQALAAGVGLLALVAAVVAFYGLRSAGNSGSSNLF